MILNYLSPEQLFEHALSVPDRETIDLCIFSVDNFFLLKDHMTILSPKEQKKASSLRQEQDRIRFVTSRILLRSFLGRYLNYPADKLLFETGEHGKPYLCLNNPNLPQVHFNLSHSGKFVALAFSTSSPVGIDIEKTRTNIHAETLIRRFFHPDEYSEFLKLREDEKQAFLFRRWTVREAFLKGLGKGFSMSPDSFYVQEQPYMFCITKSQKDYSSWHILAVPVPKDYYCSLAYQVPV